MAITVKRPEMLKKAGVLFIILIGFSCADDLSYSSFQTIPDGRWLRDSAVTFEVEATDTTQAHTLYFYLRNDNDYPYSNLFLIADFVHPDGASQRDTLEYEMADAQGNWLGSGLGSVKESKLGYKKDVVFPVTGVYTISVAHAMRKNGNVEGLQELPGVLDVGLQIETNK